MAEELEPEEVEAPLLAPESAALFEVDEASASSLSQSSSSLASASEDELEEAFASALSSSDDSEAAWLSDEDESEESAPVEVC